MSVWQTLNYVFVMQTEKNIELQRASGGLCESFCSIESARHTECIPHGSTRAAGGGLRGMLMCVIRGRQPCPGATHPAPANGLGCPE